MEQFDAIFVEEKSAEALEELVKIRKFPTLCLLLVQYDAMLAAYASSLRAEVVDDHEFAQANLVEFQHLSKELLAIPDKGILGIAFRLIFCVQQNFLKDFKVEKAQMNCIFDRINRQYMQDTLAFCSNLEAFFLEHHHAEEENHPENLTKENETDVGYLLFNEFKGKRKALLQALKNCKWFHYFHQPNTLFDHPEVHRIINCKKEYISFLALLFHELALENYIQANKGKGYMQCLCKYILCEGKEVNTQYMHNCVGKIQNDPKRYVKCIGKVKHIMDLIKSITESGT